MRVYGRIRGTDPVILKLRSRWRCLARFTLQPLYLRRKKEIYWLIPLRRWSCNRLSWAPWCTFAFHKRRRISSIISRTPYAMKVFNTVFIASRTFSITRVWALVVTNPSVITRVWALVVTNPSVITKVWALVVTNPSVITRGRRFVFLFSKAICPALEPTQTLTKWVGALQT
jgi:hypothetical protein